MNNSRREILAAFLALSARANAHTRVLKIAALTHAMSRGRFVTYQPTGITAVNGKLADTNDDSIRADLRVLRPWFDSLITYSCLNKAERVADVAATLGFRALILGIWDFSSDSEIQNALAAAKRHPELVVGCSLGNETVLSRHGTWSDVAQGLRTLRKMAPHLAVATTEPFAEYLDHPEAAEVLAQMDFMLVNIHPIFEPWFRSGSATNWTELVTRVLGGLESRFKGPILVKETGVPSGPATSGFSETMQREFWRALGTRMRPTARNTFSYFSAFDSPWRAYDATPVSGPRPEEAHWGLFTARRSPKRVMIDLAQLR